MFTSSRFDAIEDGLNALTGSILFDLRSTPQDLIALRGNYRDILAEMPELRVDWPDGDRVGHEQLLLFAFLARLGVQVAWRQSRGELPGRRSLVVCDRQSWWTKGRGWYREVAIPPYASARDAGYACEVRALLDKSDAEAKHVLRWINLVDSELWAIGRVLRAPMPDGRRADEHLKEWARRGHPDDPVLTQEVLDAFAEKTPNAAAYIERVLIPLQARGRSAPLDREPWHEDDRDDGATAGATERR